MLPTLARRVRSGIAGPAIIGRRIAIIGRQTLGRDRAADPPSDSSPTEWPDPARADAAAQPVTVEGSEGAEPPLDTRAVIVLGGGSDIGIAVAAELVARGAETVVLAGRNREQMREQALEAGIGVRIETVHFDARHPDLHVAAIEEAFTLAGEVQAVVVAFGVLGDTESYEANPGLAGGAMTTNFAGAVSASLAATRALARQPRAGALVLLSSVAAVRPRPSNYIYGASKAGLDFFGRGLAASVRSRGVRVLVVRPGLVETKMTQGAQGLLPRLLRTTPDRVAHDIMDALKSRRTVCWSPGYLRWLSIGLRIAPGFLARRL